MLKQFFQLVIGSITSVPGEIMFIILGITVLFSILIKTISSGRRGSALSSQCTTIGLRAFGAWWHVQAVRENLKYYFENRT